MPYVEGISQYQNNTASNTQALEGVKETIRPSGSLLQELTPGKVFEGTVTEVKNQQVTIGLSDGQTISARMENGVYLEKGSPMLFEVRSNSGEQISLRPVTLESPQNPTLLTALEAAGLKVTPDHLSMVRQMMEAQLPVDRSSLIQMARALSSFPKAELGSLIQMQKLGIPINEGSVAQFESYKNNQQVFLPEIQNVMEELPQMAEQIYGKNEGMVIPQGMSAQSALPASLLGFQQQVVGILMGGLTGADGSAQAAAMAAQGHAAALQTEQDQMVQNLSVGRVDAAEGVIIHQDLTEGGGNIAQNLMNGNFMENSLLGGQKEEMTGQQPMAGDIQAGAGTAAETAAREAQAVLGETGTGAEAEAAAREARAVFGESADAVLNPQQQRNLTELLQEFSGAVKNPLLLPDGTLNTNLTAGELLSQIVWSVENSGNYTSAAMQKLFYSDEYKNLLKQAMADQWLTTPEQLKEEGAVRDLYQRLGRQMEQLQHVLEQSQTGGSLAKTVQNVQSNLEFMNQLNQVYAYVQLPLKLQHQKAHSDLYVYTNKKNLRDPKGELSALLHLDMENLGSTDVYVKMLGTAVEARFYLSNDKSFELVRRHVEELSGRLAEKGYQCSVEVENRKIRQNPVEEFLEQEKPAGKLQRFSFDVKA